MNNILQLKGRFDHRTNNSRPGYSCLPKNSQVQSVDIRKQLKQIEDILHFWQKNRVINGALVSVHYKRIVAKSNRLKTILSETTESPSDSIRGARFETGTTSDGKIFHKHVFTHYVSLKALERSLEKLRKTADIIDRYYDGTITDTITATIGKIPAARCPFYPILSKNIFLDTVVDCFYVDFFSIDSAPAEVAEESIITIFKTNVDTKFLLSQFGINIFDDRIIDETTLRLDRDETQSLLAQAPYLIAMNVANFSEIAKDYVSRECDTDFTEENVLIPHPNGEPIVGVIDTQFNTDVYFSEWVDYHNMLDPNIPLAEHDFDHGTAVSSIIVDGPLGNPNLDDGCGRFRVRHFGVATNGPVSSFSVLRLIRRIIAENRDIKVWNLSLGSVLEIKDNFISPEAAELDRLQSEYDIIFVVAGTNRPPYAPDGNMKIGSPADSLNSMVVNSVRFDKHSASYTRTGPVLSFFNKPDISYYGGDGPLPDQQIVVCKNSLGAFYVSGTSFAAPWITRKLAYLIHIIGLSRELAKALIIDSAAGWNSEDGLSSSTGYGVVPIRIEDILHTSDDEIRFVLNGIAEEYETYTYNLPVPVVQNNHPFFARATLVYFPKCDRNQGVDYTSTEMDIHFGRLKMNGRQIQIKSLNNNKQADPGFHSIYEEDARAMYRKWDNVKHISDVITSNSRPRKAYDAGLWGLSIKTKERVLPNGKRALPFGVVITLKEMNGVNRFDEFKQLCMARNWLVSEIDVHTQIDIYLQGEEDIDLE